MASPRFFQTRCFDMGRFFFFGRQKTQIVLNLGDILNQKDREFVRNVSIALLFPFLFRP
jgi:hypothetical protein